MPRSLGTAMQAGLSQSPRQMVQLLQIDTSPTPVRLTTAPADPRWSGLTWTPASGRLVVSGLGDQDDPRAQQVTLVLGGVDTSVVALLLSDSIRGCRCSVWYGHLDPATGQMVSDPVLMFRGLVGGEVTIEIAQTADPPTVTIATRPMSRLADLRRAEPFYTDVGSHYARVAAAAAVNDTFFVRVATLAGRTIRWGTATPTAGDTWTPRPKGAPRFPE